MKSSFTIFIIVISSIICLKAETYFVSESMGNDTFDGLTISMPWKSLGKVQGAIIDGDSILFKRGDLWTNSRFYSSRSNTYFGTYGDGEKPIFTNLRQVPGSDVAVNWIKNPSDTIWQMALDTGMNRLFFEGIEQLRSSALTDIGIPDSEFKIGNWFYANDTLFVSSSINPAFLVNKISASSIYAMFTLQNGKLNTIDSLDLRGGTGPALTLANIDSSTINGCLLGLNSASGLFLNNGSDYNTIQNNIIDSGFKLYHGIGDNVDTYRGCGDGINIFNDASHNTIINNTIVNWAHNGIEIYHKDIIYTTTNYNYIAFNDISAPDLAYGHPIGVDGPIGRCAYNEFAYNYLHHCRTANQINGDHNWFHHNVLKHFRRSVAKDDNVSHGLIIAKYESDTLLDFNVSEYNIFENNLFEDIDEAAIKVIDFGFGLKVNHIIIRNNIFIDCGLDIHNNAYPNHTSIYIEDDGTCGTITTNNNLIYQSSGSEPIIYFSDSESSIMIDEWNTFEDSLLIAFDNLKSDPLLDMDDTPLDASPSVNNGFTTPTTPALDYLNQARVIDNIIDIGPIENQNLCNNGVVIYVDHSATGAQNGNNWLDALSTIQAAYSICPSASFKRIWVAQGTYYPTSTLDRTISFVLPDSVHLFGSFVGGEVNIKQRVLEPLTTILSGDIGVVNDTSDNTYQVIHQAVSKDVRYDGVSIVQGNSPNIGGAIMIENSEVNFHNCSTQFNFSKNNKNIYIDAMSEVCLNNSKFMDDLFNEGVVNIFKLVEVEKN